MNAADPSPTDVRDLPGVAQVSKTISEADVYQFAGMTGDLHPVHVNADYAAGQPVGNRVAHGVLIQGLMSAACTQWALREGLDILSYGWDRVRFTRPVYFGDTITAWYAADPDVPAEGAKRFSRAEAFNQHGDVVAVGHHIAFVTG